MSDVLKTNKESEIDEKKLNRMKTKVLFAEKNNISTNARTDNQMIEIIKQIIIEEAKKCY